LHTAAFSTFHHQCGLKTTIQLTVKSVSTVEIQTNQSVIVSLLFILILAIPGGRAVCMLGLG
jgi:hypothetical protein